MSKFHKHEWDFQPTNAFRPSGKSMRLYGKDEAPAPDPNVGIAAAGSMELARAQYEDFKTDYAPYIKEQMGQGLRIASEQNDRQGALQEYQMDRARVYNTRWDNTQVPLEDELIGKARAYNEDAEQERMAAQAGADVNSAYARSDEMLSRDLASRGVNVNGGNYVATKRQNAVQRAGASSAAVNKVRQAAKDIGWTRLGEAAALGRGLPTFGTGSASLSMNAGQAAFGAGTAGTGFVSQASGTSNAGYGAGGGLYSGAMGGLNQSYSTQVGAAAAAGERTSEAYGMVAGAGTALFLDRTKPPKTAPGA